MRAMSDDDLLRDLESKLAYDRASMRGHATLDEIKRLPIAGDPAAAIREGGESWTRFGWRASVRRHKPADLDSRIATIRRLFRDRERAQ